MWIIPALSAKRFCIPSMQGGPIGEGYELGWSGAVGTSAAAKLYLPLPRELTSPDQARRVRPRSAADRGLRAELLAEGINEIQSVARLCAPHGEEIRLALDSALGGLWAIRQRT